MRRSYKMIPIHSQGLKKNIAMHSMYLFLLLAYVCTYGEEVLDQDTCSTTLSVSHYIKTTRAVSLHAPASFQQV
jgi:hypothetical protein